MKVHPVSPSCLIDNRVPRRPNGAFQRRIDLCSPGVHLREVMVKARPCNSGRREHEAPEVSAHFPSHPKPKEAAGEA